MSQTLRCLFHMQVLPQLSIYFKHHKPYVCPHLQTLCFYSNYISRLLLASFPTSFYTLYTLRTRSVWCSTEEMHFIVKVNMCAVDVWGLLPPWQACHGRMKKIARKGRGEKLFLTTLGIFSLCCTKSYCVAREGKMRNTWAVKGFFHGNLRLCMHFFSYSFQTEKTLHVFLLYPHPVW